MRVNIEYSLLWDFFFFFKYFKMYPRVERRRKDWKKKKVFILTCWPRVLECIFCAVYLPLFIRNYPIQVVSSAMITSAMEVCRVDGFSTPFARACVSSSMSCSKIDRFLFSLSSHRNFADFPAFDQPYNFPSPIISSSTRLHQAARPRASILSTVTTDPGDARPFTWPKIFRGRALNPNTAQSSPSN